MITRTLLLIPIMILAACSSDTVNSADNTVNPLSSPQDNTNAHQSLEPEGKYSKVSNNERKKIAHSNNTYYKSKANVVHIPGSKQVKINIDDSLIIINLISNDGSYLIFKNSNDYLNKFAEIGFNYTYDTDLEDAIKRIKVFKSPDSEQGILILPEGTEEYPTYTISPFDSTGIKHSYTAEIQSFDCDNFDTIILGAATLNDNVAQSVSISQKGKPCKVNISDSKVIGSIKPAKQGNKFKKSQQFMSNELTQTYSSNLYQFYNFDVNADGIKDKIITHKNNKDNVHQGDDLFIYLGTLDNKYKLSLETNNFTDEAGWFLNDITPRSDYSGFILTTYFADRGHSEQSFYFGLQNDKWLITKYVSAGTLITGVPYYCIENHSSDISNVSYGESSEYSEAAFEKNCPPLVSRYKVTANKAEILDQNFKPQIPSNYYVKGDVIEAVAQNEDWIKVSYKQDRKYGWVDKGSLKALR
ncbi:hypothetical protein [Psychrobacter glacincola]|uniref:hypothetical protein n=1 Tax=Psychrobacter glacincola TaxID=56810 RepID=UPI0039B032D3